jgi:hypothetical protein
MPGAFALCTFSADNRPVVRDTFHPSVKPASQPTIVLRIMPKDGERVQRKDAQETPFLSSIS